MQDEQQIPVLDRKPDTPGTAFPELLAPAGDWECARAAVENGADAIYFGLERFNARMRANNFCEADLPRLLEFLHRRGVKGYVTFNTLVFENEMAEAVQYVRTMVAAGVDAAIVQDVGICRLIRRLSPDFPIHVSTQMTVTSARGVSFARDLGCNLVVLARECSLKDIELIQAAEGLTGRPMPLEVFVHGALCVAYSGQCLTSESLGGRSANRGECAQACRMPYELVADGKTVPLGDRRYLLSPQDLAGLDILPELVRLGAASLKIEGRLKSPEYVASITRIYRQALDDLAIATKPARGRGERTKYEMEMAFSRGLYTGWFRGTNNQALVHAHFGKKRGVYLGEVGKVTREGVVVQLKAPLKPGDGIVFDAGRPEEKEEGGRVYEVRRLAGGPAPGDGAALLTFGRGDVDFERVQAGDKLWKTSDPELEKELRQTFGSETPRYTREVHVEVHGRAGTPLTLILRDDCGNIARASSAMPLAEANKQPLDTERLRGQLGRLGGTGFRLGRVDNALSGKVLLPVSELNRMRREAVGEIESLRAQPRRWTLRQTGDQTPTPPCPNGAPKSAELVVLVRNEAQLETAMDCGVRTIYCEFEDPKKYRDAVAGFRARNPKVEHDAECQGSTIWVAPPRVYKIGEEWILNQVRSSEADGYLVRNYDHLAFFQGVRRIGDYSLNVANSLTAEYYLKEFGLEYVTASYDLNFVQLEALLTAAPPAWFEITIHQHMPMFHMEHCVFCAFLSTGTDYRDCGRPCDRHDLKLRDRVGSEHPVKADAGCRNTVFNSLAQTGAEYMSRMQALGVTRFRLEFLNESSTEVARAIGKYRQVLRGEITGQQLWKELRLFNQLGVTRGQMGEPAKA